MGNGFHRHQERSIPTGLRILAQWGHQLTLDHSRKKVGQSWSRLPGQGFRTLGKRVNCLIINPPKPTHPRRVARARSPLGLERRTLVPGWRRLGRHCSDRISGNVGGRRLASDQGIKWRTDKKHAPLDCALSCCSCLHLRALRSEGQQAANRLRLLRRLAASTPAGQGNGITGRVVN